MSKHFEKLKEIILDKLNVEAGEIVEDASFIDDLGCDSLDIVELIMSLEDEFDIEIPDEEVEKIITVKDVLKYIEQYAKAE